MVVDLALQKWLSALTASGLALHDMAFIDKYLPSYAALLLLSRRPASTGPAAPM